MNREYKCWSYKEMMLFILSSEPSQDDPSKLRAWAGPVIVKLCSYSDAYFPHHFPLHPALNGSYFYTFSLDLVSIITKFQTGFIFTNF